MCLKSITYCLKEHCLNSEVSVNVAHNLLKQVSLFFLILFINSYSQAQQFKSETGDFDLKKVTEAAFTGVDTSIADSLSLNKETENYTVVIFRVIVYLAIVIAVIFGVAWIVRKSGLTGTSKIGGGGSMDILEILPLGQNRNVSLVRVMDSVYLLGQTPNSIVLLEKIEGQKAIDLISSSKDGSSIVQFKDALSSFLSKMKKPG